LVEIYSRFGASVGIWEDIAVIGAPYNDSLGAVYVYTEQDTGWIEESILTASDGESGDYFGSAVSVFGDYIAIGAPYNGDSGYYSGSCYIYKNIDGIWVEISSLTAFDADDGDRFGSSVSLYNDKLLVGAYKDDDNQEDSGSVYVFSLSDDVWTFEQKLIAWDGAENDRFGYSLSLSENSILVGSYWDDVNGSYSGSAYIFEFDSGEWVPVQKIIPDDGFENYVFGFSVSLSGGNALIGAYRTDDTGAAYFFADDGLDYTETEIPTVSLNLSNFPNPFNPTTTISFETSDILEEAYIEIYNVKGQKADKLILSKEDLRKGKIVWNADEFASGVYFYKFNSGNLSETKKMILIK